MRNRLLYIGLVAAAASATARALSIINIPRGAGGAVAPASRAVAWKAVGANGTATLKLVSSADIFATSNAVKTTVSTNWHDGAWHVSTNTVTNVVAYIAASYAKTNDLASLTISGNCSTGTLSAALFPGDRIVRTDSTAAAVMLLVEE